MPQGSDTGKPTPSPPAWSTAGVSTPTTPGRWDSSWPAFVPEPQRRRVLDYFAERFGIPPGCFDDYHLLERRKLYAIMRRSPHLELLASLKVQSLGLPVLRKMGRHLKPTTAALQRFGSQATRNRLELTASQVRSLLQQEVLPLRLDLSPGYVILLHEGHVLGCGLYTPGLLRSQIPRRQAAHQRFETTS